MLYYHQEPKQNCAALNVPARNKELVMGTKISEAVQESNCSALAFITCWGQGSRGEAESALQSPAGIVVVVVGFGELLPQWHP